MNKDKRIFFNKITMIVFIIYILILLLSQTAVYKLYYEIELGLKLLKYICYSFFSIRILYDWKNGKNITVMIIITGIMSVIISFFTKNNYLFTLLLAILAVRTLNKKDLIKIVFKVVTIAYFSIIVLSLFKVFPDWIFYRGDKIRHSLGFCYATDAISFFLNIILMYFYIRDNYSLLELFGLEAIAFALFLNTDGRMSFILISIVLLIMAIKKNKRLINFINHNFTQKTISNICISLPTIFFLVFNFLTFEYTNQNELTFKIDKFLSGRLYYSSQAYIEYGVTAFGENIKWQRMGRIWICKSG